MSHLLLYLPLSTFEPVGFLLFSRRFRLVKLCLKCVATTAYFRLGQTAQNLEVLPFSSTGAVVLSQEDASVLREQTVTRVG